MRAGARHPLPRRKEGRLQTQTNFITTRARVSFIIIGKKAGKIVKHKARATTIVAPKSVGSMTTKGQMKPTCRVSLTASQAAENSQSNVPEYTIVSSILTDLIFRVQKPLNLQPN